MVEKVEGVEMSCKSCGTDLICHMSNYKGDFKNKLQWQNADGSAHYKFNGKDYSCVIPEEIELNSAPEPETSQHETLSNYLLPVDNINSEIDKLIAIEEIVTKKLTTNNTPPNPAKVGMYMKFVYDILEKQN